MFWGALLSYTASLAFQYVELAYGAESRVASKLGRVAGGAPLVASTVAVPAALRDGLPWPLAFLLGACVCPLLLCANLLGMRTAERLAGAARDPSGSR